MPDIEKIKKGLEACGSDNFNLDKGCDTCPYYDFSPHHDYDFDFGCIKVLARDTLELLKEQQAVIECLERKVKQFEYEKSWDECPDRMNGGGWT